MTRTSERTRPWAPGDWRHRPAAQQPDWPDERELQHVLTQVAGLPPLVFAGETGGLRSALAKVAAGEAFLLQAGDCAESFGALTAEAIADKLKVILQMSVVLTYGAGLPVVKVGRIAGQFAKPRSRAVEVADGAELPAYRGDMINGQEPSLTARTPDPWRVLRAYHHSAATLNLLRAFSKGGLADLRKVHSWNLRFVASSPAGKSYEALANGIAHALRFMAACGQDVAMSPSLHETDIYTSHEALLLAYEEAMTRWDSASGSWYDTSAHLLWAGDRTRQLDGAHLAFLAGIGNPVAVKLGPTATPADTAAICELLNPGRVPGRLVLITRLGVGHIEARLPLLIEAVQGTGHPVVWVCDPMHGNTIVTAAGHKTRRFTDITAELASFFAIHRARGTRPGGIHVELTGEDVTECVGGAAGIHDSHLALRYQTACDPRLNASQAIELAFRVGELLQQRPPAWPAA